MKSYGEATESEDMLSERSNAPSPDDHGYREQWSEAVRQKGTGDLRQIETEMAILDLIARVEKLEGGCDVSDRGNVRSDVGLRGGMGARDEDEEFVYDYGGYTNWDELDAKLVVEPQRQASKEKPKIPIPDDGHCIALSASPHLLCRQVTSQVGDVVLKYSVVYLPPGFMVQRLVPNTTNLTFSNALTLYCFSTSATEDVMRREAWKQKECSEGHWPDIELFKLHSHQEFKSAIANMWEMMGLDWDVVTREEWSFEGEEGDIWLVDDNNLFRKDKTGETSVPRIRGGAGEDLHEAIQRPASVNCGLAEDFRSMYERLMQEAMIPCPATSPPRPGCTGPCMVLAAVLQTRNCFLERELQAFQEMNDSLVQDRNWQMGMQVELEEQLEAMEAEKDDIVEELGVLKKRWERLTKVVEEFEEPKGGRKNSRDETWVLEGTIRGGNEESEPSSSDKRNTER